MQSRLGKMCFRVTCFLAGKLQCCGSGMFITDPGSEFSPSRIPDPNFFHPGFFTHHGSRIQGQKSTVVRIRIRKIGFLQPEKCILGQFVCSVLGIRSCKCELLVHGGASNFAQTNSKQTGGGRHLTCIQQSVCLIGYMRPL
jgi:hypothetical protein